MKCNVNAHALTQTRMTKSVLDAGWGAFQTMLQYKCDDAAVWFKEVDERFSTLECRACGARTGPKGLAGLSERSWACRACGSYYHHDLNCAMVIRGHGLRWLENEFSMTGRREPMKPS